MSGDWWPRVSVVVPTRDRPELLPRALRSVLGQSYRDLEVLVVDDASKTDPRLVVDPLADARIRMVRHGSPRGASAARNTGMREARGEYVGFLDDDDEWLPEMVRRQVEVLDAAPSTVAGSYSGFVRFLDDSGESDGERMPGPVSDLRRELRMTNVIGPTSCVVLRRACLEHVGGFDESLPSRQDVDLWIRLADHYDLIPLRERLMIYHQHGRRISIDLEARERGLEIFERRYLDHSKEMRHAYETHHVRMGVDFCLVGRLGDGRRHLYRAIQLRPTTVRGYVYASASLLGSRGVRTILDWNRRWREGQRRAVHAVLQ